MPKKRSTKTGDKGKQSPTTNGYSLDEVDHTLLKHLIEYPKSSLEDLGKVVGLHKSSVHKRYHKPAFQKALQDMRAETWEIIKKAQNQASRALLKLTRSKDEKIALEAAKALLAPYLNKGEISVHQVQEIIHRTRFGEGGQMITDTVEIPKETPGDTLELLGGEDGKGDG